MGKLHSKHADCIFVNADLNKALEDSIWKKKTGFNLANYNMEETLSELSICLEDKSEPSSSPLRVELPPPKLDTETSRVLTLDHIGIRRAGRSCELKDKTKLNIEELQELECGVHLEGSDSAKHEWSFTLYDFDGHGRITKEDLASLLKALYDAVGSSIKLPANGAKTLKLRLSVGQDGGSASLQQVPQGQGQDVGSRNNNHDNSTSHQNGKNNFNNATTTSSGKRNNVASGAALAAKMSERSRNTARAPKNKVREFSKLNNLTRAAASEQKLPKHQAVKCTNEHRGQQAPPAALTSAVQLAPPPSVCSGARDSGLFLPAQLPADVNNSSSSAPGESAQGKDGLESPADDPAQAATDAHVLPDHQCLADLVQENMERNRVRQQLRRLADHRSDGHHRSQHHPHPHYNYHSRHHKRRHQRAAAGTSSSQRPVPESHPGVGGTLADPQKMAGVRRLDASAVSRLWTSGLKNLGGDAPGQEDTLREEGDDQGCARTCGLLSQCGERGKSSEAKDKKPLVSLSEAVEAKCKGGGDGLSRLQEERAEESQDRRNYYLDLAGVENTSSRFQTHPRTPQNRPGCSRRCHKGHHRSRSQDLATAHVITGDDVKFSNVIAAGKSSDVQRSAVSDLNDCLSKPNNSGKCDNLLFSAVAFGLSLASETPHMRDKRDSSRGTGEHMTVGNSVVRMLATAAARTESLEHQHHGRSKSFDPQDILRGSSDLGHRARRNHKPQRHPGEHQLPESSSRAGAGDHLPASSTKLNPLNLTVSSSGSTTTTDNNKLSSANLRSRRFRPVSLPGHVPACVSPHQHRRHRHRDKDHSQAMQQVARWIEREQHAWDQDTSAAAGASSGDHVVVQRHEHHHIHEHHHHHHYHHYHET